MDGCSPLSMNDFSPEQHLNPRHLAVFIMVDEGECDNPTKVRNVQEFGGSIALINELAEEDIFLDDITMRDYGASGHNLVTPGFMIDYKAAEKIKETIENEVQVVMRASLTIANSDNQI